MSVLVGGVGQLYQGDLDLGRRAAERLGAEALGPGVAVEELHYGAVAVAQRLEDLRPAAVVLVGAGERGRPPGTVQRRRVSPSTRPADEVQRAVADAVTGYVTIDLVVGVGAGLGALPARTVIVEVEPARTGPSEELSPEAEAGLDHAVELVRAEVRRVPVLELADELRALTAEVRLEPAPALDVLRELLGELERLDEHARWGGTFRLRDRLRRHIAEGRTGEGMASLDWSLWWALIEELDRLQARESV